MVELSDDDSDETPVGEEEIPRSDSLELGAQPGSLLLYLRFKHDAFEESIKSLGGPLEPLLQKYLAILNQLERETDYVNAGLQRLYKAFVDMSR